jgi:hypothetical protein
MSRKTLITLFAALVLGVSGAASSALAGDRDDGPSGGYHVGPLGQELGGAPSWGSRDTGTNAYGTNAYGLAPAPAHQLHKHVRTR